MTTFESSNNNSGKEVAIGLLFFSSGWPLEVSVSQPVLGCILQVFLPDSHR